MSRTDWEVVIGLEVPTPSSTRNPRFSPAPASPLAPNRTCRPARGYRAARRAAGAQPRRRRARDPLRPLDWRRHRAEARSSPARTTSTPICPRVTRSASSSCQWWSAAKSPSRCGEGDKAYQKVRHLTRAHLEEDAGKSLHEDFHGKAASTSTAPARRCWRSSPSRTCARRPKRSPTPRRCIRWCAGSTSATATCRKAPSAATPTSPCAPAAGTFGTRREIKNLNSFRFLQQAIDYEIQWQIDLIEDGGKVQQATVLFDPDTGETRAMRSKEDAHDYRYFPDPDLLPLVISATSGRPRAGQHARAAGAARRALRG
jgi:aspartyl-tRNA(Asn)/glutamyl-tRNA(Gln) amidotransferase subunit B